MWMLKRLVLVPAVLLAAVGIPTARVAAAADPCVFEDARLIAPTGIGVAPSLGTFVAMSGDAQTIVATESSLQTTRVYRRTGATSWTLETTLPGGFGVGRLGNSGSTLLTSDTDSMKIWTRSAAGVWSITSTIGLPPGASANVYDISADGQTVAVGAPQVGGLRGSVYVFRLQNGVWVQDGPALLGPVPQTTQPTNFGGTQLRLDGDGDTLVVGATSFNAQPPDPVLGAARGTLPLGALAVYRRASGGWLPEAQVLQGSVPTGAAVGIEGVFDVSDDGRTILAMQRISAIDVSGPEEPQNEINHSPAAFVFGRTGEVWAQRGEPLWLPAIEPIAGFPALLEVALSQDARRCVIAMTDVSRVASRGRGFVFEDRDGLLSRRFEPLTSALADDGSVLGMSAAISADGSTVALGAPNDRNGGGDQGWGSAIVYTLGSGLTLTSQPVKASVPRLGSVGFSCSASARVVPQYRWTLDGVPLTDGVRPDGMVVSGSATSTLSLTSVAAALDGAVFACEISAACESTRSNAVSLRVMAACIQDLNGDGAVNTLDLVEFLSGFGRSCP